MTWKRSHETLRHTIYPFAENPSPWFVCAMSLAQTEPTTFDVMVLISSRGQTDSAYKMRKLGLPKQRTSAPSPGTLRPVQISRPMSLPVCVIEGPESTASNGFSCVLIQGSRRSSVRNKTTRARRATLYPFHRPADSATCQYCLHQDALITAT
jgi:hypothetical protein